MQAWEIDDDPIEHAVQNDSVSGDEHLRVPAGEIERIVIDQVRRLLASTEVVVATLRAARRATGASESEVREALLAFQPLRDEHLPAEQARIVQLLVERVQLLPDHVDVVLKIDGFSTLVSELDPPAQVREAA